MDKRILLIVSTVVIGVVTGMAQTAKVHIKDFRIDDKPIDCEIKLQLGWILPSKCIHSRNKVADKIKTGADKAAPFIDDWIDEVEYTIAYEEKTREITYINTSDSSFRTENGLKVGSCLRLKRDQIIVNSNWEIYGPITKDGWYPVIGYNTNRPQILHQTEIGEIVEDGDPTLGFVNSDTIEVKIKSFSKAK